MLLSIKLFRRSIFYYFFIEHLQTRGRVTNWLGPVKTDREMDRQAGSKRGGVRRSLPNALCTGGCSAFKSVALTLKLINDTASLLNGSAVLISPVTESITNPSYNRGASIDDVVTEK